MPELTATLKGVERAAVVLMALGESHAAEILRHLDPRELHKLGVAMAGLTHVNRDQISEMIAITANLIEERKRIRVVLARLPESFGEVRQLLNELNRTVR